MKDELRQLLLDYGIYREIVDGVIDEILEIVNED